MGLQEALLTGASIGFAIAAPVGPTALIVIRRTLANGFLAGISTGAGATTVHTIYATLAVCGMTQFATQLQSNRKLFNVVLAVALFAFAIRLLRRRGARKDATSSTRTSLIGNYASAVVCSMLNPMCFALVLSATASLAGFSASNACETSSLAAGVLVGSVAWWLGLVGATALIGMRLSSRSMRLIDILAGGIMFALAVSTVSRNM